MSGSVSGGGGVDCAAVRPSVMERALSCRQRGFHSEPSWAISASLATISMCADFTQDGLQAGGDDVERNFMTDTEFVELLEVRVDLELFLHDLEAVLKRDV
jgi:hypothetical protein